MSFIIMILMMISIVSVIPIILLALIPRKSLVPPFPLSEIVKKCGLLLEIVTMLMMSWSLIAVSVVVMVPRGVVSPMIVILSMIHLVPLVSSFLRIEVIS